MKWLEISITLEDELVDPVADLLVNQTNHGLRLESVPPPIHQSKEMTNDREWVNIRAYLGEDGHLEEARKRIELGLWHLSQITSLPEPTYHWMEDEDWAESWKKNYHPIKIGQEFLVRPAWIDIVPGTRHEIILDPGMAFGTGTHPTTRLCLQALETIIKPGDTVLDMGCGSGILSIGAARLGASGVRALDIDPIAVKTARENIERNRVGDSVLVHQGSLENLPSPSVSDQKYDVIVCNILTPVLIQLLRSGIHQYLGENGTLILSGIMVDQEPELITAIAPVGLTEQKTEVEGDWLCLIVK